MKATDKEIRFSHYDNYELSIRAVNALRAAGFKDMYALMSFVDTWGVPAFKEHMIKLNRSLSSKTNGEVIELLLEQGFLEPEPEPKEPELEYPQ